MNNIKFDSSLKKGMIVAAIMFVIYQVVIFSACGFEGHGASFWWSYAFMNIAFISASITFCILRNQNLKLRDFLLGFPFYYHCTIYLLVELFLSILFMVLDYKGIPWSIPFIIQIIVFAIFVILIVSCFSAKEIIEQVQADVKKNTKFTKLLLVDIDSIVEKVEDEKLKSAFSDLRDAVKYSDPVSCDELSDLEERISAQIIEINACISCSDNDGALVGCKKAMLLVSERSRKCKALK